MAQQLGSGFDANKQHNVEMSDGPLSPTSSTPSHLQETCQGPAQPIDSSGLCMTAFGMPNYRSQRHRQLWTHSWFFQWAIGTLRVSVSTSAKRQNISPDYRTGGMPPPQKSYRIRIEFIPAQALIQLRGLQLVVENTSDQRGFYQICPFLSTFAIIPEDAKVIQFVRENDVEGIQDLFQKGLAAPSDRDSSAISWDNLECVFFAKALQLEQSEIVEFTQQRTLIDLIIWISDKKFDHSGSEYRDPSYGANIHARWEDLSSLQYLFYLKGLLHEDQKQKRLPIVEVAIALLEQGADLFALDDDGDSVFDTAEEHGLTSDLFLAVQRAGYDLDEVKDKIAYLQWVFDNPNCGIAESTAIDSSQIGPSSITGLTPRRAIVGDRLED
ncbi:MAG: hypothetical protein Q9204_007372 [Flavoplaca sp. TL-2023a]